MSRKSKASTAAQDTRPGPSSSLAWRYTKVMNMRDLSRDDDYLSHLFVEKLANLGSAVPFTVHKMDSLRRLPRTDAIEILTIVHGLIRAKPNGPVAIKQAVNELLSLPPVQYFIKEYDPFQINAFATHASRYLELYLPSGSIEIAQTSRYSKWTGKSELCIVATRPMVPGFLIAELKGSLADLTEEEDKDLKRTGNRNDGGTRRDFSVIHSKQLKKNHLFLGPARFVNHDCDNNAVLFRSGRYITFRAIKAIAVGQEITAHYGDGYFGRNNRHCLCETCERLGKGGYAQCDDDALLSPSTEFDSDMDASDTESSTMASDPELEAKEEVNLNERRTRRGVYVVMRERSESSDEEMDETPNVVALPNSEVPKDMSESPLSVSRQSSISSSNRSSQKPMFKSLISTRGQKAREESAASTISQLRTPPASGSSILSDVSSKVARGRPLEPIHPPVAPRPRGRPRKNADKTLIEEKKQNGEVPDSDTRQLRIRKSMPTLVTTGRRQGAAPEAKAPEPHKVSAPSGPRCITCSSLLPAPPTPDRILRNKGKAKEVKEECGRCKRHFFIFNASWPHRNPNPGSAFISTPRECSAPSDHRHHHHHSVQSNLPVLDKKLKQVRDSHKRPRVVEDDQSASRGKRRKITPPPPVVQKLLSRVSGRTRMPSLKVRESSGLSIKTEAPDNIDLSSVLDKNRPHRQGSEVETAPGASVSIVITRSRGMQSRVQKRPGASADEPPVPAEDEMDGLDDRRDKSFWPCLREPPNGLGMKDLGLLTVRPNPYRISRWRSSYGSSPSDSAPNLVDDDTDDTSEGHPGTPEHDVNDDVEMGVSRRGEDAVTRDISSQSPLISTVGAPPDSDLDSDVVEVSPSPKKLSVSTVKGLGLFSRPSPVELARRIWAPTALVADSMYDEPNSQTITPHRASNKPSVSPTILKQFKPKFSAFNHRLFNTILNKDDDSDLSSDEDLILPDASDSSRFKLQSTVNFKATDAPILSPKASEPTRPVVGTISSSPLTSPGDPRSSPVIVRRNRLRELSPSLRVLGPLHSDFITTSSPTNPGRKPSFVNAGWESDSSL